MPESHFSDGVCAELSEFARIVWGHSDAVIRRTGSISYIDLEPYPALRRLFAGPTSHNKILIRQEYHTAYRALESDTYYNGAYVTGQAGIGKSLFLVYVLVMRLGQKREVVLQLSDGRPYYAILQASGVSFHSLNHQAPLDEFCDLWVLVDSNGYGEIPGGIFLGVPEEIRVIHATSPNECNYKWSKRTYAAAYIMDIWSIQEIADLSELLGLDSERMTFLAKQWGGVPRNLLELMDMADSEIENGHRALASVAVLKCQEMIFATTRNADQFDAFPFQIFFCRPMIDGDDIDHRYSCVSVPTRTIFGLLEEALQTQTSSIKVMFFNVLVYLRVLVCAY